MNTSQGDDQAADEDAGAEQAHGVITGLSPQVKRLIIGAIIMFACWVIFVQTVPHTIPPAMQVQNAHKPPAPAAEKPAAPPAAAEPQKPAVFTSGPPPAAPPAPQKLPVPDHALEMLQAKVAEQSNAIAALQHQQEHALHIIALMDAYDRLKERTIEGRPFAEEFSRLRALAGNDPALNYPLHALEPYMNNGIPRLDTLQRSYGEAAQKALHPVPQEGSGVLDRIKGSLAGFISIRRVGDVPGNSTEAILARAEAALDRQEIDAAITELGGLQGLAKQAMQPWLAAAQANATRDRLLANLRTSILARSPPSAVTP